jgi:predicted nucleic acid-binding protein
MPIYLDTCCLNRPYDDQTQPRIQMETAAILSILQRVISEELQLADSSVLQFEVSRIADQTRRNGILHFLSYASSFTSLTPSIEKRGAELHRIGFKRLDALHLAAAEFLKVDALLTTDDPLLRLANQPDSLILVPVLNPLQFPTS